MSIPFRVNNQEIILDESQKKVFYILEELNKDFIKNREENFLIRFLRILKNSFEVYKKTHKEPKNKITQKFEAKCRLRGLYLYGNVGRGKSMLMRDFFNKFPDENKLYIHFNSFMQKIHRELHKVRQNEPSNKDELIEIITKNIVQDIKLLCLDEFQVDDVTDALILRRIFSYIFSKNIIVVFTSNKRPENLYLDGLQRELFLKFINEVLKKNCQIYNLDSEIDYREKFLHKVRKHYFYPINQENQDYLLNIMQHLSHEKEFYQDKIKVLGRELVIQKSYENIAVFDFKELCVENLGVADYQEICKKYHIIFLLNIPKLTKEDRNEAKRFILLIDEIYENKNILLALSDVKIEEIYQEGKDSKIFKRTVSRLKEIISDNYGNLSGVAPFPILNQTHEF